MKAAKTCICTVCNLEKEIEQFSLRTHRPSKPHHSACKKCIAAKIRRWRKEHPDHKPSQRTVAKRREWAIAHKKHLAQLGRIWHVRNRNRINENRRKRLKIRRMTDPAFRALINLQSSFHKRMRNRKVKTTEDRLLGCSLKSFRIYLESLFEPGMTWENYGKGDGKWQVDHIMPCAIFDLSKPEHQKRCWHFSNLQPMWQHDNARKHTSIITSQFKLP